LDLLSGREQLVLHARLKRVPEHLVSEHVTDLLVSSRLLYV
jgi:hypothetical protein